MNFAKNSVCLQCDAKRPKRQLLPGEWECPQYESIFLPFFNCLFILAVALSFNFWFHYSANHIMSPSETTIWSSAYACIAVHECACK